MTGAPDPRTDDGPPSVFLSHSGVDIERARELTGALERSGHKVWLDRTAITGGVDFRAEMLDAVVRCDVVVFLYSPAAADSVHCRDEVRTAERHRKKIVVQSMVENRPDRLPHELSVLGALHWFAPDADASELMDAVRTDFPRVRQLTRIDVMATAWAEGTRPPGRLLRGEPLADAAQLILDQDTPYTPDRARPSDVVREYVLAGQARQRRTRSILAVAGAVLVAGVIAALAVGLDLRAQEQAAQRAGTVEQVRSEARRLAATDPAASLALIRAAYGIAPDPGNHAEMAQALLDTRLRRFMVESQQDGATRNKTRSVVYGRDGSTMLSGGVDGVLRVYGPDATTPTTTLPLGSLLGNVATATRSDQVATSTADEIVLQRAGPGASLSPPVRTRPADFTPSFVSLSPDGSLLASGGLTPTATVLSTTPSGELREPRQIRPVRGNVTSVEFAEDVPLLAVVDEGAVSVWDFRNQAGPVRTRMLPLVTPASATVAFGPGGLTMAVGDAGTARLYDLTRPGSPEIFRTPPDTSAGAIALAPPTPGRSATLLVTIGAGGVSLWDTADGTRPVVVLRQDRTLPRALAVSPTGDRLAVGGEDGSVVEWELSDRGQPITVTGGTEDADINDVAPSHAAGLVGLATTGPGPATVIRLPDGVRAGTPDAVTRQSASIDIDDRGATAVGSYSGFLAADDAPSMSRPRSGTQPEGYPVNGLRLGRYGTLVATENGEGPGFLWRLGDAGLALIGRLEPVDGPAGRVAFSPDGSQVAVGGRDGTVVVYTVGPDVMTRDWVLPAESERSVNGLTWLPDNRRLAVSTELGLRIVEPARGSEPIGRSVDREATRAARFAAVPDVPILVSSGGGQVVLWDISDQARPVPVAVRSVGSSDLFIERFSKDGRWLAIAGTRDWRVVDVSRAVATAADPLPAVCMATAATAVPAPFAAAVARVGGSDPCER